MGSTKTQTSTSTQATPTPEETALNQRNLRIAMRTEEGEGQMQENALALGNQLLTSFGQPGSDQWQSLIGGVTPEQQQRMINEQWRNIAPGFQTQGIYDSGLMATAKMRSATDLANQNAQFNVGVLQNALNLALSGQAQVQQPIQSNVSQLGGQLAGLRTINQSQTTSKNPFMESFYTSLGSSLGSGTFGRTKGYWGMGQ